MPRGGEGEPWEGRHGKLTTSHSTRGSFRPRHHWPAQCHTTSITGPGAVVLRRGERSFSVRRARCCNGCNGCTQCTGAVYDGSMALAYHVRHAWQGRAGCVSPQLHIACCARRTAAAPSFFGKHSFSIRMFVSSEMRT